MGRTFRSWERFHYRLPIYEKRLGFIAIKCGCETAKRETEYVATRTVLGHHYKYECSCKHTPNNYQIRYNVVNIMIIFMLIANNNDQQNLLLDI